MRKEILFLLEILGGLADVFESGGKVEIGEEGMGCSIGIREMS